MTRFLSQALNAYESEFRRELMELEAANGHPNEDIKLSIATMNSARAKCRELGLDPKDTTPEELYHALIARVKTDDQELTRKLRTLAATSVSAEADPVSGMVIALKDLPDTKACFALKISRLRTILKKLAPKKTMKAIGYRSVDSMLKHENPIEILAVACLVEPAAWQKKLLTEYKQLKPSDFEERPIKVIYSTDKRYLKAGQQAVENYRHNILSLKELGAVVLLPLPEDAPDGVVTASLSLALHEMNEIRSASNYLKIHQFKYDFGSFVAKTSLHSPELNTRVFGAPVAWSMVQKYYARFMEEMDVAIFEPYLSMSDMAYHAVEDSLEKIEPRLSFWRNTGSLGLLDNDHPVSLNLIDNALNLCNKLPFEKRFSRYFQDSLLSELLMRYLNHDALTRELQPEFAEAST